LYVGLFFLTLVLCAAYDRDPIPSLVIMEKDPAGYALLAKNLLEYGVITGEPEPPLMPSAYRTPGYPVFLAILLFIFRTPFAVPLAQILLSALTAVVIFKLGRRFYSLPVSLIATLLYVLDPAASFFSFQFMSETLFTFLFVLFLFLFTHYLAKSGGSPWSLLFLGILLGLVTLVRPITQYFAIFALCGLFFSRREDWRSRSFYGSILAFLLGVALTICPWMIRNYIVGVGFQISVVGPYAFYVYHVPQYLATKHNVAYEVERERLREKVTGGRRLSELPPDALRQKLTDVSLEAIRGDEVGFLGFYLVKTLPFLTLSSWKIPLIFYRDKIQGNPLPISDHLDVLVRGGPAKIMALLYQRPSEWLFAVERLGRPLLFVFCLVPLWSDRGKERLVSWFLFGVILYFAILTGPLAQPRYRLPAEPSLFLLGLRGIELMGPRLLGRGKHRGRVGQDPLEQR
jgi:4-amino-4-deoxy-L-arabinose transferase-like glycosyltransferase